MFWFFSESGAEKQSEMVTQGREHDTQLDIDKVASRGKDAPNNLDPKVGPERIQNLFHVPAK